MSDLYNEFIQDHLVNTITKGKSGADVYELDNNRIAKHVLHHKIENESIWNTYKHESMFYSFYAKPGYSFLPKIYTNICNADEILIIMEKYRSIERQEINERLLQQILMALANVHSLPIPSFLDVPEKSPSIYDESIMTECMDGWQSVLDEHKDAFDHTELQTLRSHINEFNKKLHSTQKNLLHGDFHFDNVLLDQQNNIVICDWQNCCVGNISSDISFFLSRLSADGCHLSTQNVIKMYCTLASEKGIIINPDEVDIQIRLANLNTSFCFWHIYLHGCTEKNVANIYFKMIEDMKVLLSKL